MTQAIFIPRIQALLLIDIQFMVLDYDAEQFAFDNCCVQNFSPVQKVMFEKLNLYICRINTLKILLV